MPAATKPTGKGVSGSWMPTLGFRMKGDTACIEALQEVSLRIQKSIVRQCVRSAMGPIAAQTRRNIKAATKQSDQSTGHLLAHMTIKVQQNKKKPWQVYGLVGARRDRPQFYRITQTSKTGRVSSRDVKRKATNYLHLLENGFIHYRTGRIVPGRKVLSRAMSAQRSVALQRYSETFRRLLPRYVAQARARARSRTKARSL